MADFGYPYNDLGIIKDSPDYLHASQLPPVQGRITASEFSESFLPEHGTRSVDKNYTMFKEFITLTMKEHIPNKLTSTRTNLPWFNRGLKRMCKVKRRRFKRAKK